MNCHSFKSFPSKISKLINLEGRNSDNMKQISLITKQLQIQDDKIQQNIQIYQWRLETKFPIAKINSYFILPEQTGFKNINKNRKIVKLQVQDCSNNLRSISEIPLFKILYLMKESLVGLQRLFNKFGGFYFNSSMIFINDDNKCKVWVNMDPFSNYYISKNFKQPEFLSQVFKVFEKKTLNSKQKGFFYEKIYQCKSFFQTLELIQSFAENQKIKIPSNFKLYHQNQSLTNLDKRKMSFGSNLTMSRKPNFLMNSQLNTDYSQESPRYLIDKIPRVVTQMKLSKETQAQTPTKILQGSTESESNQKFFDFRHCEWKRYKIWNSDEQERHDYPKSSRKLSGYEYKSLKLDFLEFFQSSAQINKFSSQIKVDSLSFCQNSGRQSICSIEQDLKMTQSSRQICIQNGWNMRINSLLDGNQQFKQSIIQHHNEPVNQQQIIKLDLLDQWKPNLTTSLFLQ